MNLRRWSLSAALALAVSLSCSNPTEGSTVAALIVQPDSVTLDKGDSIQLNVSAVDNQNHLVTGVAVAFHSNNGSIATVTNTGMIRTAGALGKTYIVVSGGGKTKSVPVEVVQVPAAVLLSPADTLIWLGMSVQLSAAVVDGSGDTIPGLQPSFAATPTVVTVSPSGLVTAGTPGTATVIASLGALKDTSIITVTDSTVIGHLPLADGPYGAAVSASGVTYITRLNGGSVERLNLRTRTFVGNIPVQIFPTQVAFNPLGTRAYVSNQGSQSLSVIDAATHSVVGTINTAGDPVPMQMTGNGQTLFVTTNLNRLYKVNLATGTAVDSLDLPATSHHLLLHPNNTILYVSTRAGGSVLEVNASTMSVTRTFTIGGTTQAMALAPNNGELYVANENANVYVLNLTSGTVVDSIAVGAEAFGLALGPDGTKVYAGLMFAGEVKVIDRVARTVLKTIPVGGSPREMATASASGFVVVANLNGWVDLLR